MSNEFADVNGFDTYARAHGGWYYDNSRTYHDTSSSCYAGHNCHDDSGELVRLVLLYDCLDEGQSVVLQVNGWSQPEVWTGPIRTKDDLDALQTFVEAWNHHHRVIP
jgi:hypothetical protein